MVYRRSNRCKIDQLFEINYLEVFFVVISIRVKSRTGRVRLLYGTLKRGREPQKVEKHCITQSSLCFSILDER